MNRLVWLIKGAVLYASAAARLVWATFRRHEPVGLGVLEGAPWARQGVTNGYRVRIVNGSRARRKLRLECLGHDPSRTKAFAASGEWVVDAGAVREVYLVSDWSARFDIEQKAPQVDALGFVRARPMGKTCRLEARLLAGARVVDRLAIEQRLAE